MGPLNPFLELEVEAGLRGVPSLVCLEASEQAVMDPVALPRRRIGISNDQERNRLTVIKQKLFQSVCLWNAEIA